MVLAQCVIKSKLSLSPSIRLSLLWTDLGFDILISIYFVIYDFFFFECWVFFFFFFFSYPHDPFLGGFICFQEINYSDFYILILWFALYCNWCWINMRLFHALNIGLIFFPLLLLLLFFFFSASHVCIYHYIFVV